MQQPQTYSQQEAVIISTFSTSRLIWTHISQWDCIITVCATRCTQQQFTKPSPIFGQDSVKSKRKRPPLYTGAESRNDRRSYNHKRCRCPECARIPRSDGGFSPALHQRVRRQSSSPRPRPTSEILDGRDLGVGRQRPSLLSLLRVGFTPVHR